MTDNLVQATARAIANADRHYYDHGDEYYEGLAEKALAVARPIIERETLKKAATASHVAYCEGKTGVEIYDAIRALGGDNAQDS